MFLTKTLLENPNPNSQPTGDALDKKIGTIAAPAVLNLLILPLVGIVDMMWIGRMKDGMPQRV